MRLEDETVWVTQKAMVGLFQKGVPTIKEQIKNIYSEEELTEEATIRKNRIVQIEGSWEVTFYNLEMIIAVATIGTKEWRSINGLIAELLLTIDY